MIQGIDAQARLGSKKKEIDKKEAAYQRRKAKRKRRSA